MPNAAAPDSMRRLNRIRETGWSYLTAGHGDRLREAGLRSLFTVLDISSSRFATPKKVWSWTSIATSVAGFGILGVLLADLPLLAAALVGVAGIVLLVNFPWIAAALFCLAMNIHWTLEEMPVTPAKPAAAFLVAAVAVSLLVRRRLPRVHWMHLLLVAFGMWCLTTAYSGGYDFVAVPFSMTVLGWAVCVLALNQLFRGARGLSVLAGLWVVSVSCACAVVLVTAATDNKSSLTPLSGDVNDFALLAMTGVFLGIGLARDALLPLALRAFFVIGLLVCLTVAVGSMSRGTWLALAVGMIVQFLAHPGERKSILGATVGIGALAAVTAPWYLPGLERAWAQKAFIAQSNVSSRLDAWTIALHEFTDRPFTGIGIGTLTLPYYDALSLAPGSLALGYAHNTYVEVLYGTGLIGALLFFTMLVFAVVSSYRAPKRIAPGVPAGVSAWLLPTVVGVLVASFTVTEVMYAPIWMILAMTIATSKEHLADEARGTPVPVDSPVPVNPNVADSRKERASDGRDMNGGWR